MERFLHHCLEELHSQTDMKNLIDSLSQRIATHQSRVRQLVYSEPLENIEVTLQVLLGVAADQPMESNFFPGILEDCQGGLASLHLERRTLPPQLKRVRPDYGHQLC